MTEPFLKPGVWYDPDQASCAMVEALGLYHTLGTFGPAKWVFYSANPVGDALADLLARLCGAGVLEANDDGQFRLRPGYTPDQFADIPAAY